MADIVAMPGGMPEESREGDKKRPSRFGMGFYIILTLAVLKDLSDILLDLTVIGAPITSFSTIIMDMIVVAYLFMIGVKPSAGKVATFAGSFILDVVPGLSFLPMTTLNLYFIRYLDDRLPS
ncbi:hypothetical protein KW797_04560 [Candidatus Parcubacteria bacterium]|nr:hypothetical protein [Candidatus Parcubacteria bacterium]